ncbi:DUF1801 domain-containing protein [Flavobacterium sp. TP390]|uniref:DUF1801 domain-containing protein n=1 Tax=Flavobacterium profundi TaxID=1774945 RepID=A0A6I4ILN8_9FLAO|nr:DUF1801 domain-containing protein [Flavobacterium profundi]MVO09391.1 DUF1801 domain-containing protein [Flavobacterium profundi]
MDKKKPETVEEYIEQLPENAQLKIKELRSILKSVAPKAKEGLKWGKPVFELETILFAYSAHKSHLSFIPTGPALKPFEKELTEYITKKDSVQFSFNNPLPENLILKIAEYRKKEVEEKNAKWYY